MANLNRDYLVTLDVKTSNITLSSPMTFYVTDRRTMNIFVKLVMNMSDNPVIKDYVALENAIGYRTELVLVSPNNQPFYLEGELLNGDEALFCFNLDTEQISKIGDWVCELRVYSVVEEEEEIVTSKSFLYSVNESITTSLDDVVLDDTTYGIIDELIGRIEALEGSSPGGENDTRLTVLEATKYDDVQVQKTQGKITLTFYAKKMKMKTVEIPASEGLEQRVADCEESIAWLLENGGGGGGVVSAYLSTTDSENFILTGGTDLELHLDFYSPNIGRGTLKVTVDDVDVMSSTLSQGESTVVITGDLLHKGVNVVKVYAVDRVGTMTNTLIFNVRYGSTELTTTFDPYQIYDLGAVVRYYFTAVALNTADKLKFYMSIDGQTQTPVDCTSDVRAYFTFPILSVGSHYCEAWVEDSYGKSNTIAFNFVVLDDSSLTINSTTRTTSVEEGAQLILDYRVYMKNNNKFITETYIDDELINTGECNADTNYYTTSSLKEGQHTVKIIARNMDRTVSDYVSWIVNITPSTYEMKQPVTTGAIAMFTAKDRTNSDQDRGIWTGKDQDGAPVVANLSGFSYDADNGWNNNELIISGKSTVEIPIAPLANNARYGFTLDIEFTSKQIGAEDAEVLTLWNETDNCGIRITTERLILRSKAGNECNLFFSDNENVSAMFIIDRDEKVAKIYLNGVMCEAFSLSDYVAGGQSYLEDFTVDGNIILGGGADKNGYCKIKNLRVYEVALATNEILNNWLSNITDKATQRDMEKFQNGDDLPTLTVYCDFAGLGKDDKKPCDIIYYSPDVTKYGESFTLSGKTSLLQYQGTSSMQYPIKNYRLNLRDIAGEKWYYNPFNGGQAECRFCLKADFMSSGHWQNTGLAKFVSDKLYGYKTSDLSTMNPAKRYDIENGGTIKDTRDSINGFPCRLILVNDGSTPLNEGQQEPTPGNTKDMGIFNFNNDKDNVSSLGLDNEIFPNCLSYEVTANSDTSAGAFVPYEASIGVRYYTAWQDYLTYFLPIEFAFSNGEQFTVSANTSFKFECYDENFEWQSTLNNYASSYTLSKDDFASNIKYIMISCKTLLTELTINNYVYSLDYIGETDEVTFEVFEANKGELEYLQNSFELRYPDEDDVGGNYGYLGMEGEVNYLYYDSNYGLPWTHRIKASYYDTKTFVISIVGSTRTDFGFDEYDENGTKVKSTTMQQGDSITLQENTYSFQIYIISSTFDYILINGVKYFVEQLSNRDVVREPFRKTEFSTDYGLKRVIDWVGNCTDEEFVADYEKYFDKHYLLRYYLLVITLGMVDNLGKNMMLDTWDGQIWYPRFYDMDTICSYDNSGAIKFDVDIEMEQGYWNTSSSRLWTKVRDLLHDELVVAYKDMRASGLSYDGLMNYFYGEQISKIPQKYYNMDADVKYLPYADAYLGKAHGNGYEHLKRWLKNRLIFTDTLFDYGPSYESDMLTIRANTLDPITFEIETYTPVYQHVSYYNGQMSKLKIDGKTATTFTGNAQTATDQEILIYGGSNIKRIRGISSANPDSMLIGNATKLSELDISNCPILVDVNSNKANFAPHQYLNKLNIENCPQLGGTLELTNSPLIQEIKARGTAINGLRLPTSVKNLETLELPNTINSLALYDATSLETLKFDEGVAMQSIELSNCTGITNTENFDLTKTPTVILDNSYNTEELYMSETTNLTLRNMSNLEKVIYTPNSEYSEFDINNVINGKNYKVTTNNCPKLTTFITTAPHRLSYNNDEYKQFIEASEKVYTVSDMTENNSINWQTGVDLDNASYSRLSYTEVYAGDTIKIESTHIEMSDPSCWVILYDNNKAYKGAFCYNGCYGAYSATNGEAVVLEDGYMRIKICNNDTDGKVYYTGQSGFIMTKDITPNTVFTANTLDLADTQFQNVKLLCTTDVYNLKVPTTMKNFYCDSAMDIDTDVIEDGSYEVIHEELIEPYTTNYEGEVLLNDEIPNIIPSSANGSLIFNMYSNNTTQPTSTSPYMWDLTGLKLNDFYTYGMNNWVKGGKVKGYVVDKVKINDNTYTTCRLNVSSFNGSVINTGNDDIQIEFYSPSYISSHVLATNEELTIPSNATQLIFIFSSSEGSMSVNNYYITLGALTTSNTTTYDLETFEQEISNPITMPQRMPGYSVRLVNADITPNEYPTMLYPKLIDTTLPITGKLDYTKYNGTSLAWAYAYTTGDVTIDPVDSRNIGQITQDYNKLYGTDFVDVVDVWVYKDTDTSKLTTNEAITKAYIELTSDNYMTRINEALQWYPNCTDLYFFEDGSVTDLTSMMDVSDGSNSHRFQQIQTITFMEGYFDNLTSLSRAFRHCHNLTKVTNIPNSVEWLDYTFEFAYNLQDFNIPTSLTRVYFLLAGNTAFNKELDFSNCPISKDGLTNGFANAKGLEILPILPSNYTGSMKGTFNGCSSLTQAPTIPQGVDNMYEAFCGCTKLTTVPAIPSGVTTLRGAFRECKGLTTASLTGLTNLKDDALMDTFNNCSNLVTVTIEGIDMTNVHSVGAPESYYSYGGMFQGCGKLEEIIGLESWNLTKVKYACNLYKNCWAIEKVKIPLQSTEDIRNYNILDSNGTITKDKVIEVIWEGLRKYDLNIPNLVGANRTLTQAQIKDLVNNHLDEVDDNKTLTLGETYLAYLTEDEIAQAVAKGWTLQ